MGPEATDRYPTLQVYLGLGLRDPTVRKLPFSASPWGRDVFISGASFRYSLCEVPCLRHSAVSVADSRGDHNREVVSLHIMAGMYDWDSAACVFS